MSKVIVIHPSIVEAGGIVNAAIFYAAALIASGTPAEIWTASKPLAEKAAKLSIPVFYHSWLRNADLAILHPKIVARALRVRKVAAAAIHQGGKLWLFGRIWLHGVEESVVFHNRKIGQRRLFRRWLAVSEAGRAELEAHAAKHGLKRTIRKINNGPLPEAAVSAPRERQGIARIGCMGNFGRKKAIDVLVRAFAKLAGRGYAVELVLAGDGPERAACEALAQELGVADRISWPGWLTDTGAFYGGIDLFCLPSIDEPFGIVVTEAMQAGLPVAATATFGPREIVIPGETGWLVPPGDADALADALEEAVKHPERARAYGLAGRARFESTYSLTAAGKRLREALDI